jgi:hypothetical protein
MNSKYIMIASSVLTGILGLVASFFPTEVLTRLGFASTEDLLLLVQITGALYFGFAAMNWMAKTVLMGGIYARPLVVGNFAHFMIAALTLIKAAIKNTDSLFLWISTATYFVFACLFGVLIFTSPVKK